MLFSTPAWDIIRFCISLSPHGVHLVVFIHAALIAPDSPLRPASLITVNTARHKALAWRAKAFAVSLQALDFQLIHMFGFDIGLLDFPGRNRCKSQ